MLSIEHLGTIKEDLIKSPPPQTPMRTPTDQYCIWQVKFPPPQIPKLQIKKFPCDPTHMHKLELLKIEMIQKIESRLPGWSDTSSGAE
jgi:hypothetical protein